MEYAEIEQYLLAELDKVDAVTKKGYAGEFSPDSFGQIPVRYPAVMLYVGGFDNKPANLSDHRVYEVRVYAADSNLAGEAGARSGVYALMQSVRARLNRCRIPGMGRLILKKERIVGYSWKTQTCVMEGIYHFTTTVEP